MGRVKNAVIIEQELSANKWVDEYDLWVAEGLMGLASPYSEDEVVKMNDVYLHGVGNQTLNSSALLHRILDKQEGEE